MSFLKKLFQKIETPIKSYADFWIWFQKNEKVFFNVVKRGEYINEDFFDKLKPKLNEIKVGFYYLTGMCDSNTAELIITADGDLSNIAFVEDLVNAAPILKNWKFTALKPPLDIKDVNIEMSGYKFSSNNIYFYENESTEYPDEVDITIIHDDYNEDNQNHIVNGIYIFLDNYLGELNFVTDIDEIGFIEKNKAEKVLVPISKLKDFLIWREKEFLEKYQGVRNDNETDTYSLLEGKRSDGSIAIAVINTDLLNWDGKASHPWIAEFTIQFDGNQNNGLPDENIMNLLNTIEEELLKSLKGFDGYLNIGRQTANGAREIYFACRDFRKPSKIFFQTQKGSVDKFEIDYKIYKDKYWKSFERFAER